MIIYKATNTINGMSYIGQTIRGVEARIAEHVYKMNTGSNSQFHNALRKYGVDTFTWYIIDTANDIDELNVLEAFYIDKFDTFVSGYNLTTGGMNHVVSEETKQKMSKSLSGENNPFFGKTHSEETKQKMRKNSTKWKSGQPPMLGRAHSEQTKKLMSKNRPNQSGSNNHRYGKDVSPDTRDKLRKSALAQFKNGLPESTKDKLRGPRAKVTCPHCDLHGGISNMKRFHFDNCKSK